MRHAATAAATALVLLSPHVVTAQSQTPAPTTNAEATPTANAVPTPTASQGALSLFRDDPEAYLAQDGDLSFLIASVVLADPAALAEIEAALDAIGAPAEEAAAVAEGFVLAAQAASAEDRSAEEVAAFVGAAVRTDAATVDAVVALATETTSISERAAIGEELASLTKDAVEAGSDDEVVTTLARATVTVDPGQTEQLVEVSEQAGVTPAQQQAIGTGLGEAANVLQQQGDVVEASAIQEAIAASTSSDLGNAFVESISDTTVAAIPTTAQEASNTAGDDEGDQEQTSNEVNTGNQGEETTNVENLTPDTNDGDADVGSEVAGTIGGDGAADGSAPATQSGGNDANVADNNASTGGTLSDGGGSSSTTDDDDVSPTG